MTRTDAAYIAGLVDGEGSIGIFINRAPSRTNGAVVSRLKIGMCDEPLIQWLSTITNRGRLTNWRQKHTTWKPVFVVTWNGYAAAELIGEIRPFLRLKRPQADLLLEWIEISKSWQSKLGGAGRQDRKYPESVWDQAEALAVKMRLLNHRGTPVNTH